MLSQHPVVQPLWLRQVVYKGATSNTLRCYVGSTGIAAAQTMLMCVSSTFAWGNALLAQVQLAGRPASGVDDTVSVGGVERAVAA